jgi:hypothetical protein
MLISDVYLRLKMIVRPKHVADNLNKIVNNYWNKSYVRRKPLNVIVCDIFYSSLCQKTKSRDSAVGIATDYGLDNRGVGVPSPFEVKNVLPQAGKTGSGAHQASYSMGTGGSFPAVKRQGREADHSPTTSAEVNKTYIYTYI